MGSGASWSRRDALRLLGATTLAPLAAPHPLHPLVPPTEPGGGFEPRFLKRAELDLVADVAELVIPTTDTPGAKAALVHQYVDWILSESDRERQREFRRGLAWLDRRSRTLYGRRFRRAAPERQVALLERLDREGSEEDEVGVRFFRDVRALTIDGYYRSEIGMRQELGYRGNGHLARFPGCTHEEHHGWEPSGDATGERAPRDGRRSEER